MRMSLILDREIGHYEVLDLVLEHNYALYLPETFHLMPSQRNILYLHAFEIETVNDSELDKLTWAYLLLRKPGVVLSRKIGSMWIEVEVMA
jgi:hypothetical protein